VEKSCRPDFKSIRDIFFQTTYEKMCRVALLATTTFKTSSKGFGTVERFCGLNLIYIGDNLPRTTDVKFRSVAALHKKFDIGVWGKLAR